MSHSPILSVERLCKVFYPRRSFLGVVSPSGRQEVTALDGVTFGVKRGAIVAVSGASGSGKSTLARLLVGLLQPTEGSVFLAGEDVFRMGPDRIKNRLRRRVRLIFQHPDAALNPGRTVRYSLAKSLRLSGKLGDPNDATLLGLLDSVALAKRHLDRYPDQLSGGEKRRVAIAGALATEPDVVIGDEMFSGLDALTRRQILGVLLRLQRERGLTLIIMTHQTDFVDGLCDLHIRLESGRVISTV